MKNSKKRVFKTVFLLFLFVFTLLVSCKEKEKKKIEKIYNEIASELDCLADPSWFPHTQTTAPLEGKNSPFNNGTTVSNLDFHKWSWQKFLWLTKPVSESNNTPLFLYDESFFQVDDVMIEVSVPNGANVSLLYDEQACSNGILQSNPNYNSDKLKSETILYSLHTNTTMMTAANGFVKGMKSGEIDKKLNYKTFPVGSLEMKVSWIVIDAIPKEKRKNYYVTMGAVKVDEETTMLKEVALLGMHVVGVVENHPEFIWATFEHNDMAPSYDWKKGTASSDTDKLLFKKGNTNTIDGIYWVPNDTIKSGSEQKIIPAHVKSASEVYDLFEYGVPRNVEGGFMKTSQKEPQNYNNIKDINNCVHKHLKDVWNHYFYNGSIWLDTEDYPTKDEQAKKMIELGSSISSAKPGSITRGSLNCANVSMETFTQTFNTSLESIKVDNLANCFSCHGASDFQTHNKSPLYISHIFNGLVHLEGGQTREEINTLKDKEHLKLLLNHVKK